MKRIKLNFSRYTDANFLAKARHILAKLTGNANFPSPTPTLVALSDSIDAFSLKFTAALELGKDNVADKNKARVELNDLLVELGLYVMFVANGDETILISSGYDLAKDPSLVSLKPAGPLVIGNGPIPGSVQSTVKRPEGGKIFIHQYSSQLPSEGSLWEEVSVSVSRYVHTNLLRGKEYWFRVIVKGARGQETYTDVVSMFVQ